MVANISSSSVGTRPASEPQFSPAEVDAIMAEVHGRGDRIAGWFILGHAMAALLLAFVYDTWFVTLAVTAAAVGMFFISRRLVPRSFLTRCVCGVSLQTFVALHIYQMHGLAEMHFFFFTAFTMMIVYQDWKSMWPGALLIIGQHIVFAVLHNTGTKLYFFEVAFVSFTKLFYHFGIALVQVGVCGYWAFLFRRQTLSDAWQQRILREKQACLEADMLARQRAEAERDRLFAMSLDLLCVGGFDGYLKQVNPAWIRALGWSAEELLRHPLLELVHADDRAATLQSSWVLASGQSVVEFENRCRCQNGSYRWLSWNSFPMVEHKMIFCVVRDVTERKQAEAEKARMQEQLLESHKMETLGTLAGGIAHDFNNQLTGINCCTEMALKVLPQQHPARAPMEQVLRCGEQTRDIVRRLLLFARRGPPMSRRPMDLTAVVRDNAPLVHASAPATISVELMFGPSVPLVMIDVGQLEQVLINLCTNSVQAIGANSGTVTISVRAVQLPEANQPLPLGCKPGLHVGLEVRDTGAGMDAKTRARIFDPFFTTKPVGGGTGLGLAVVRGIIADHGGGLRVESKPGRGARFELYLPACAEREDSLAAVPDRAPLRGTGQRILGPVPAAPA